MALKPTSLACMYEKFVIDTVDSKLNARNKYPRKIAISTSCRFFFKISDRVKLNETAIKIWPLPIYILVI